MKETLRIICSLAAVMLISACGGNKTVYVSPDGDDTNPGTVSKPFKTLSHAVEAANAMATPTRIILKDGEYPLDGTVEVKGISGLRIEAAKGAAPVLTGEIRLEGWTRSDEATLSEAESRQVCSDFMKDIWVADLHKAGIEDVGGVIGRSNRIDIYFNGKRLHPARWPNEGYTRSGKALGATPTGPNYAGYTGSVEGIFEYTDERIDRWAGEKEPYVHGYWFWDWSEDYNKVESINPSKRTISVAEPYHGYGYRDGFRYYGLNLLCELDTKGEYYLDREAGRLFILAPDGFDPAGGQVTASLFSKPYMLEAENCKDLTIEGLTFRGGRNGAVSVTKCINLTIKDCVIEQFGDNLMSWIDSKDCTLEGCLLREMGHGGIVAKGGDRKTLEPAGYRITDNIFKDISLYKPTYEPPVICEGAGMLVDHNWFGNCASSALRLEGNDMVVEYNHFENLVTESDDQGGIDVFYNFTYRGNIVRYNWWQDITGATREGAAGVRLDDIISGYKIYGNVFVNCGGGHFGAVQIHGGMDNFVENNIMYDCRKMINATTWSAETFYDKYTRPEQRKRLEEVGFPSELYKSRYPELALEEDPFSHRNFNTVRNNLCVNPEVPHEDAEGYVYEGNTELDSEKPLEYFLDPKVLKDYGLAPIPWKEMGLKDNKFKHILY